MKKSFFVTICREWSLVKSEPELRQVRCLYCRSWGCDVCQPKRKSQVIALALSGDPQRFITLTAKPDSIRDPIDQRGDLSHAWAVIVKRLKRKHPNLKIEYFVMTEATKAGQPHLHILFRGPWVPQRQLSAWMGELTNSPVVDIRVVKNGKDVANYVAKYIGKEPARFGTYKRYWTSEGYELDKSQKPVKDKTDPFPWRVDMRPRFDILDEWTHEHWVTRREGDDLVIGYRAPPTGPNARSDLPGTGLMP